MGENGWMDRWIAARPSLSKKGLYHGNDQIISEVLPIMAMGKAVSLLASRIGGYRIGVRIPTSFTLDISECNCTSAYAKGDDTSPNGHTFSVIRIGFH
jgi:hypothetical protein